MAISDNLKNEFTGKPYTIQEKFALVATVMNFPICDPKCITKFSKCLELDLNNGRHLYFAGIELKDKLLSIGYTEADILEANHEFTMRMFK
jgi:hypothetical protein